MWTFPGHVLDYIHFTTLTNVLNYFIIIIISATCSSMVTIKSVYKSALPQIPSICVREYLVIVELCVAEEVELLSVEICTFVL